MVLHLLLLGNASCCIRHSYQSSAIPPSNVMPSTTMFRHSLLQIACTYPMSIYPRCWSWRMLKEEKSSCESFVSLSYQRNISRRMLYTLNRLSQNGKCGGAQPSSLFLSPHQVIFRWSVTKYCFYTHYTGYCTVWHCAVYSPVCGMVFCQRGIGRRRPRHDQDTALLDQIRPSYNPRAYV